jgi:hypothetical protein
LKFMLGFKSVANLSCLNLAVHAGKPFALKSHIFLASVSPMTLHTARKLIEINTNFNTILSS